MSKVSAEVDNIVSATAWAGFPALHAAVLRWADLARSAAAGLHISAVPVGMDFLSVRLTSTGETGEPREWIEFLVPSSYLAERSLEAAAAKLQGRAGNAEWVVDPPPGPAIPEADKGGPGMAKNPAKAQPKTGRTKSARIPIADPVAAAPAPAAAKSRARKPATGRPAAAMAPRAETRASPASGGKTPAAKPARKPATAATPAARSSKPASTPAPKPAGAKPRASGKRAK